MRNLGISLRFIAVVLSLALFGCATVNRYEGEDAALIERRCDMVPNGQLFVTINQVDGKLVGSGTDCSYVYRLPPGEHALRFIANAIDTRAQVEYYGTVTHDQVRLQPRKTYLLSSGFDGGKLSVQLIDVATKERVVDASTAEVKSSSTRNAAVTALPFLLK